MLPSIRMQKFKQIQSVELFFLDFLEKYWSKISKNDRFVHYSEFNKKNPVIIS